VHRKLLPLMIEWDMRQGPVGGPGVCFTASEVKASSTGASYEGEVLRYLVKVGGWGEGGVKVGSGAVSAGTRTTEEAGWIDGMQCGCGTAVQGCGTYHGL
jgi:hypothetical protein